MNRKIKFVLPISMLNHSSYFFYPSVLTYRPFSLTFPWVTHPLSTFKVGCYSCIRCWRRNGSRIDLKFLHAKVIGQRKRFECEKGRNGLNECFGPTSTKQIQICKYRYSSQDDDETRGEDAQYSRENNKKFKIIYKAALEKLLNFLKFEKLTTQTSKSSGFQWCNVMALVIKANFAYSRGS